MAAKNTNGAAFECSATTGNTPEITALTIQCVELPKLCPFARTDVGKTSLMYTQITAPCENANEAINPIKSQTNSDSWEPVQKIAATPARQPAVPTEPTMSKVRRPTLSITDMASIVKIRFVRPIATACKSPDTLLNPARAKMSFR